MEQGNNPKPRRGFLDLSVGGPSWDSWRFGSYGQAREWRILAPTGSTFTASEISDLPARLADLAFLQGLTARQDAQLAGTSLSLSPDEAQLVRVALQVLLREIPARARRRDAEVRPSMLLKLA